MGMYTEFHFNAELLPNNSVAEVLKYMLDNSHPLPIKPKHQLFSTDRWGWMLTCGSYYFDADTHSTLRWDDISQAHILCIRCNLKNYDKEIQKFIDWIDPYLNKHKGEFLGFYRYEETEIPTLIYAHVKEKND